MATRKKKTEEAAPAAYPRTAAQMRTAERCGYPDAATVHDHRRILEAEQRRVRRGRRSA